MTPEELFEANQALAHHVARGFRKILVDAARVDHEDLIQWGLMGLWHAAQRFDASRGLQFSTYACNCIRGYILSGSNRYRYGGSPYAACNHDHGEIALVDTALTLDLWGSTHCSETFDAAAAAEDVERVRSAIDRLPPRWGDVMRFRLDGRTLTDVGRIVGVTRERVRQIEIKATERLRLMLIEHVA